MILLKLKKLQDILDLDCPNFLSFNLQIDKYYIMRTFDWPHGKSIIRIIMRTFLNSMTSIILLLEFIVKLVCSYYRCANVQIGRATYSCTTGIINISMDVFSVVELEVFRHLYLFPNVICVQRHHLIVGCQTHLVVIIFCLFNSEKVFK